MTDERRMFVVWKRPDGFHGAAPSDFRIVEVGGQSRIWLHKTDTDHFPFRISGGWQEAQATQRLNNLVNLLNKKSDEWIDYVVGTFNNSMSDKPDVFFGEILKWLGELKSSLKGDTWETEIMSHVIVEVERQLTAIKRPFLAKVGA